MDKISISNHHSIALSEVKFDQHEWMDEWMNEISSFSTYIQTVYWYITDTVYLLEKEFEKKYYRFMSAENKKKKLKRLSSLYAKFSEN